MWTVPNSQDRLIMLNFKPVILPQRVPFIRRRRFNFPKAKWGKFAIELDNRIQHTIEDYEKFVEHCPNYG